MDKDKIPTEFSLLRFEDRDLTMFTVTNLTLTKKEIGNMVYMALKLNIHFVSQECKIEMTVMDGANDTVQLSADQVIFFSVCKK